MWHSHAFSFIGFCAMSSWFCLLRAGALSNSLVSKHVPFWHQSCLIPQGRKSEDILHYECPFGCARFLPKRLPPEELGDRNASPLPTAIHGYRHPALFDARNSSRGHLLDLPFFLDGNTSRIARTFCPKQ